MLSSLKIALKDQIQFSLILFTGVFAGSIFTLIYIKLWEKGDVTFADIGGMLAGIGTIGLLFVGLSWKKQISYQNHLKALSDWYIKSLSYNRYLKNTLVISLAAYTFLREEPHEIKSEQRSIKVKIEATKDVQALSMLNSELKKLDEALTRAKEDWHKSYKEYIKAFYEVEKQKYPLEDLESILLSLLTDQAEKNELLQLNEYFHYDGQKIRVNGLRLYEDELNEAVNTRKIAIDRFYTKSIKELH